MHKNTNINLNKNILSVNKKSQNIKSLKILFKIQFN